VEEVRRCEFELIFSRMPVRGEAIGERQTFVSLHNHYKGHCDTCTEGQKFHGCPFVLGALGGWRVELAEKGLRVKTTKEGRKAKTRAMFGMI